jgi:two-component system, OmpR family, alkaline phosphatase synthesis response regulator PhoP
MHRILAVDDYQEILNIVKTKLTRSGYEVETTADSSEVMDIIARFNPEVILMDIMMPRITGFELCKLIKDNDSLSHIKIIFLTAKDLDFARKKAEEVCADGFIAKPFSPNELVEYVDALFSK